MAVTVFYDGECPFCTRYVRLLRLRRAAGTVRLVDLRADAGIRSALEGEGFDLDQGMIVETGSRRFGGADALHALALLSTRSDRFNRANRFALSSRRIAGAVYPALRCGRWLTLFALERDGVAGEDCERGRARAEVFGCFFALFSIFHFFNYAFEYGRFPPQWDQAVLLASAAALLLNPRSARLLWLVMLASTVSTVVQAPVHSNHTMVRSALLVGYWASFVYAMARGSARSAVFANFTVAGQGTLLVMYVFGVFHKLNADFLNPETSCAVALWRHMPAPLAWLDAPVVHDAAIYGTFVAEGAIVVLLLRPRLRHWGVVGGIALHSVFALSDYAMYITFTVLSIALHALFLSDEGAGRIVGSQGMRVVRVRLWNPAYAALGLVLIAGLALAAAAEAYSVVTVLAMPFVVPFCVLVVRHGRSARPLLALAGARNRRPAAVIGAVVTALLFANCAMPYLGLKSAQAVNMFANLRLEGGVSNHLVLPRPPGPFGYLEDIAVIEDGGGDGVLEWYRRAGFAIVYYDLLARLRDRPDLVVTYTRDGRRFERVGAGELAGDMAERLHPAWLRKWFHFQPVVLERPEPCNV